MLASAGCSTVSYYLQSMHGHFSMLHAAKPISELLQQPDLNPRLRQQLLRVQEIRRFASQALGLPDNRSYTTYADLQRPFVVWNVFATPELSLRLEHWCFPVVGCVNYRGYFDRADALAYADLLRLQDLDVNMAGVPAYSTLGWFDDPVLNTFIDLPEAELARMIFHELAHQVVFVPGDTEFNESFATAVELAGVERWLQQSNETARQHYAEYASRRRDFLNMLLQTKEQLQQLYQSDLSRIAKRERKQQIFSELKIRHEQIKRERWNGFSGYDSYFSQHLNNAHLAAVGVYTEYVPAFRAMLVQQGHDFPRFFAEVQKLAALPKEQRDTVLKLVSP
jgi:predicted aminopeptidase